MRSHPQQTIAHIPMAALHSFRRRLRFLECIGQRTREAPGLSQTVAEVPNRGIAQGTFSSGATHPSTGVFRSACRRPFSTDVRRICIPSGERVGSPAATRRRHFATSPDSLAGSSEPPADAEPRALQGITEDLFWVRFLGKLTG